MILTIPGRPRTKGSMRHVGKGRMIESNPHSTTWRQDVRAAAMENGCVPTGDAYDVAVFCWFKRPKNHFTSKGELSKKATTYPKGNVGDPDKIARNVLDALTGIVWHDDCQVCNVQCYKMWADDANVESTTISIQPME